MIRLNTGVTTVGHNTRRRRWSRPATWNWSREPTVVNYRHCHCKLASGIDQLLLVVTNKLHLLLERQLVVKDRRGSCGRCCTGWLAHQRWCSILHCLSHSLVIYLHLGIWLVVGSRKIRFMMNSDWGSRKNLITRRRLRTRALRRSAAETIYLIKLYWLTPVTNWWTYRVIQWCRRRTAEWSSRRSLWICIHTRLAILTGISVNMLIFLPFLLFGKNHVTHVTLVGAWWAVSFHPFDTCWVGERLRINSCTRFQQVIRFWFGSLPCFHDCLVVGRLGFLFVWVTLWIVENGGLQRVILFRCRLWHWCDRRFRCLKTTITFITTTNTTRTTHLFRGRPYFDIMALGCYSNHTILIIIEWYSPYGWTSKRHTVTTTETHTVAPVTTTLPLPATKSKKLYRWKIWKRCYCALLLHLQVRNAWQMMVDRIKLKCQY